MAQHTPGPWKVELHGAAAYVVIPSGKAGLPPSATGFASFSIQPYIRPAEATANAHLISAAPVMLAALRKAAQRSDERAASRVKWTQKDQDAHEAIRSAIYAATGSYPVEG